MLACSLGYSMISAQSWSQNVSYANQLKVLFTSQAEQPSMTYVKASHRVAYHSQCFTLRIHSSIYSNSCTLYCLIAKTSACSNSCYHTSLLWFSLVKRILFDCRKPFNSIVVKFWLLMMMHSIHFLVVSVTYLRFLQKNFVIQYLSQVGDEITFVYVPIFATCSISSSKESLLLGHYLQETDVVDKWLHFDITILFVLIISTTLTIIALVIIAQQHGFPFILYQI